MTAATILAQAPAHPFDEALALKAVAEGVYEGVPSQLYWNMAGPFGGVTAATLMKGVLDHPAMRGGRWPRPSTSAPPSRPSRSC